MEDRLNDLLERLPLCVDQPELVDAAPAGVSYSTTPRPEFVPPPVSFSGAPLARAQVVVISAPAAVGKTMLGQFIALRTGGVLWDLSHARVGNNFALGTLAAAHGPSRLGAVVDSLQQGRLLLVADALDEARLRVNFDSFTAFIDDLAMQVAKGVTAGMPSVVLLARTETASFVADWLQELDVAVCTATIDYFDRPGATQFIRKQLEVQGADPDLQAATDARELLLDRTLRLLGVQPGEWPMDPASRFLGYAPVLVATARFLGSGGNPRKLVEELSSEETPGAIWTFLLELLGDILEREQGKFVTGFKESVSTKADLLGFDSWSDLFSPAEQSAWLVSAALGTPEPDVPVGPDLEAEYRAEVRGWLPEHAFSGQKAGSFASPVFEDYLYARVLAGSDEQQRGAVRARAADVEYRPTELLARFVFELATGPHSVEDLPVIYESLLASEESGRRIVLNLAEEADGEVHASVVFGDEQISLDLIAAGEPLVFITKLSRATVFVRSSAVHLGVGGRLLELGPEVFVLAPEVVVNAASILVEQQDDEQLGAAILTGSLTATDPTVTFVGTGKGFVVRADRDVRYPFADKALRMLNLSGFQQPREKEAAQALFRVASYFKSEGYAGLGSYADPIDRLTARSESAAAVLGVAIEQGVITKDGNIYHFHPAVLGLDFRSVQLHDLPAGAGPFVREVASRLRGAG